MQTEYIATYHIIIIIVIIIRWLVSASLYSTRDYHLLSTEQMNVRKVGRILALLDAPCGYGSMLRAGPGNCWCAVHYVGSRY